MLALILGWKILKKLKHTYWKHFAKVNTVDKFYLKIVTETVSCSI